MFMTGRAAGTAGRAAGTTGRATGGRAWLAALHRQAAYFVLTLLLLVLFVPVSALAQSRSAAEVFGVRFGINENITRVVLDIDVATRFATRVLASPPRLVIELENVRWQVRNHPQGQPVGLAQTINYGNLDAGRGRLVIDIDRPFRILRQDWLPPSADAAHHRIVVDLVPLEQAPQPPAAGPATTVARAPAVVAPPADQAPARPSGPRGTTTGGSPATSIAGPPIAAPPQPRPTPAVPATATASAATGATDSATAPEAREAAPTELAAVVDLPLAGTDNHRVPAAPAVDPAPGSGADATGEAGGETTLALAPIRPPAPAPPTLAPPSRRPIIAIDPGHGGADPGTIGINGVHEKDVTLDLAKRLRRLLEATGRYAVVLTRDEDVFVSLRDRMEAARRSNAALFISIHADSLGDSRFRGASVYTLSDEASDSEAARLARKENRADVIAGTDLSEHDQMVASILIDLAQRNTNNKSIEFADVLTTELADVTALVRNTRRFAGFVVLKSPDVPSVLLELGYLSNPTDAANLARPEYRDKLARATLRAIDRYFVELDAAL